MDSFSVLQELFERHHSMVFEVAFRITGKVEDAEDVLQTVFMRLLKQSDPSRIVDESRAYLKRAAINAALDVLRSRKTRLGIPLDTVEGVLAGPLGERPDRLRSASELQSWLRQALAGLSPRAAEVFVLKSIEGYSNQEIADLLGTSPGTVSVTLHRTRSRLQFEIESFVGGSDEK